MRRHILSVLGYVIATFLTQGSSHFLIFSRHYGDISILRHEPILALGFTSMLIQGVILSFVFVGSRFDTGKLIDAVVLAWLFGAFLVSYIALAEPAKYDVPSIPSSILVESAVGLIQYTLVGTWYWIANKGRVRDSHGAEKAHFNSAV